MRQTAREIHLSSQRSSQQPHRGGSGHHYRYSFLHVILCSFLSAVIGLYVGLLLGTSFLTHGGNNNNNNNNALSIDPQGLQKRAAEQERARRAAWEKQDSSSSNDHHRLFPTSISSYAAGMAVVDRDTFAATLDMGVPLDPSMRNNNQVLLLYQSDDAMPAAMAVQSQQNASTTSSSSIIPSLLVDDALANCHAVHVILTQPSKRQQCLAVMHQYESFHLQKFLRLPPEGQNSGPVDGTWPLRLVNRGAQHNGRKSAKPPTLIETQSYWLSVLNTYLQQFENNLAVVKTLAARVAVRQTVIVLVCNAGQAELLVNFICGNRFRHLSTDHLLVFATDEETRDLMQSLNVAVVYDATQNLPKQAASRYADATFAKMMLAKVWCVQQLVWLGYNVLFQDVDVVWFRDPLPYFLDQNGGAGDDPKKQYDMYFQDDGNHALYYAPYSANTGFYFVRANDRTRHFFNTLLLSGDLIASAKSHQIPLCALLAEHASLYGVSVHIWNRDTSAFPGGHAYHHRKDFMRSLVTGKLPETESPYILHMSWTHNKQNKVKFFQQMEEWYVKEGKNECGTTSKTASSSSLSLCCAATPQFQCHYRDKPSKRSCKDSPPIDANGRSFW